MKTSKRERKNQATNAAFDLEMKMIDMFDWMDTEEVYELFHSEGLSDDPFDLKPHQIEKMNDILDAKKQEFLAA